MQVQAKLPDLSLLKIVKESKKRKRAEDPQYGQQNNANEVNFHENNYFESMTISGHMATEQSGRLIKNPRQQYYVPKTQPPVIALTGPNNPFAQFGQNFGNYSNLKSDYGGPNQPDRTDQI